MRNLGLYLLPADLKRFLFFDSLYKQFIKFPGVVVEFGCRWGQNLAILQTLRAIYEPFNFLRTVVGFDELCMSAFPGETIAFQEMIGSSNVRIHRNTWSSTETFFVVE